MLSYLNEPLRAEVALLDAQDMRPEDIKIRLATQDDFDRLGVDRAYFLTSIQFDVVINGANSKVLLRTDEPLVEPYLDFLLETRWPQGRLLRGYTVLVDLPQRISVADSEEPARAVMPAAKPAQETSSLGADESAGRSQPIKRDYDKAAEARPRAGGQYLVQANDTLWEIASAARPSGVSTAQTMVAIVAMNGDAFIGNNINGLKAGYVLELPSEREILLSSAEARTEVAQQNADWAAGIRRGRAVRVVAQDSQADADSETQDSSVKNDGASVAARSATDIAPMIDTDTDSDVATVIDGGSRDRGDVASSEVNTTELVAIEARLAALSAQMGELRELVSLKDQQIAALQAELAARDAAPVSTSASMENGAPDTAQASDGLPWWLWVLGSIVVISLVGVVLARQGSRPRFNDPGELLADDDGVLNQDRLAPTPRTVSNNPVSSRPAPVDKPIAQRETQTDWAPGMAASGTNSQIESGSAKSLGQENPAPASPPESTIADALAEADIYVAYGRYQQALDVLEAAVKTEPNSAGPYLKMIEIFLNNERIAEAQALLPEIERLGDAQVTAQAVSLLDAVRPIMGIDELVNDDDVPLAGSAATERVTESDSKDVPANRTSWAEARGQVLADSSVDSGTPFGGDVPAVEPLALDTLELDVDVSELRGQAESSGETPAPDNVSSPKFGAADWGDAADESVVGFENDKLPPELAAVLGSDIPPPFEELDDEEESGLIYSVETDPIDTKLDLARAYIDMGDEDGARPFLEDVINKGDLRQQAEARELLLKIN